MKTEIENFLSLLDHQGGAEQDRLQALAFALDDLVVAYNRLQETRPDDEDQDAPRGKYDGIVAKAREAFPALAQRLYPCVDPREPMDQQILLADGIDDVADIARDLAEVLWRLEHVSAADAAWHFRFGYLSHWGRHLHTLRPYLFELLNPWAG